LYDLAADPLAARDVAKANEAVVDEMHRMFIRHLRKCGAADETINLWNAAGAGGAGSWARDYRR
jgi:hypothetical protein